jgi:D-arabinose 1-dehydrogenase-like Zn-dependent alcohol dehydrogenase
MILPILGHEFMGMVEDIGSEVKNLRKGDQKKKHRTKKYFYHFQECLVIRM